MTDPGRLDHDTCYRAVQSRDARFDGVFWTAVTTTGIYCRPSCPARTPASNNVQFHRSAASAQSAGYRACKRCLPDATPGSPQWDLRADLSGRAMRLIADGLVDREGVGGLAQRLGYSTRHLNRLLLEELGAGPLALARARRAQTARVLVETTDLGLADVAFTAGFSSVRQFNDTIREVYASTPSQLRGRRGGHRCADGALRLRLALRAPFAGAALRDFLAARAIEGVEHVTAHTYARTLRLPNGWGTVEVDLADVRAEHPGTVLVPAVFRLSDLRDAAAATERVRRLLDADCDPVAVDRALGADPALAASVARTPGLRVPGHVDGTEVAVRAVLGQQVSVRAARTHATRLVARHGERVETAVPGLDRLFPSAAQVAALDPAEFALPQRRALALVEVCARIASGQIGLDRGADRDAVRHDLLAVPGIGPWTADYIALRALGHPDVFLPGDTGVRDGLSRLGLDPAQVGGALAWRPWRSYALMHVWHSLTPTEGNL